MSSVRAPFAAIRRTLDSQLDDFRERRAAAASEEARESQLPLRSETKTAGNNTDGTVGIGPYLRSASEPTPTAPSPPPDTLPSTDPYLRNSWLARASE